MLPNTIKQQKCIFLSSEIEESKICQIWHIVWALSVSDIAVCSLWYRIWQNKQRNNWESFFIRLQIHHELITFQRYPFWFQHVNFRKTDIQYILIFSWRSQNKVNLELFSWNCIICSLGKGFIAHLLTFCIVSTGDSSVSGFVLHVASFVCVRLEEENSPY